MHLFNYISLLNFASEEKSHGSLRPLGFVSCLRELLRPLREKARDVHQIAMPYVVTYVDVPCVQLGVVCRVASVTTPSTHSQPLLYAALLWIAFLSPLEEVCVCVCVCVCRVTKGAALESRVGQVVAEKGEVVGGGWVGSMVEEAGVELGRARSSGQRRRCQYL